MICIKNLLKEFGQAQGAEMELLLAHVLKKDRTFVIAHSEEQISEKNRRRFSDLIKRRQRGEPMAYLLGHQPFFGLKFTVNRHVLIPRPESEWLVEKATEVLHYEPKIKTVIDIGTGSGCLIISLLKNLSLAERRRVNTYATDSSKKALAVARHNAKQHKIILIQFLEGDLLQPTTYLTSSRRAGLRRARQLPMLRSATQGKQTTSSPVLLLANLPYLTTQDYHQTPLGVRRYEPKQALLAGSDGLKYYRGLIAQLAKFPNIKFHCLWEIDPCHAQELVLLLKKYYPGSRVEIKKDLNGLYRYLCAVV